MFLGKIILKTDNATSLKLILEQNSLLHCKCFLNFTLSVRLLLNDLSIADLID